MDIHSISATGTPYQLQVRNLSCFCKKCNLDEGDQCKHSAHVDPWKETKLKFAKKNQVPIAGPNVQASSVPPSGNPDSGVRSRSTRSSRHLTHTQNSSMVDDEQQSIHTPCNYNCSFYVCLHLFNMNKCGLKYLHTAYTYM